MYRKALTIATIILSALTMAAMAPAPSAVSKHRNLGVNASTGGGVPAAGTASNPPTFAKADTNHDGLIEEQEATAIGIPFAELDIDGDRIITRSEYSIATAQHYAHGSAIEIN